MRPHVQHGFQRRDFSLELLPLSVQAREFRFQRPYSGARLGERYGAGCETLRLMQLGKPGFVRRTLCRLQALLSRHAKVQRPPGTARRFIHRRQLDPSL